jgi:ankyrin repeat protein
VSVALALLDEGAAVNSANAFGSTALHMAAWGTDTPLGACVGALLAAGADPCAVNHEQSSALLEACIKGAPGPVERLLRAGADVNRQDSKGRSPLFAACGYGRMDVLDLLLKVYIVVHHPIMHPSDVSLIQLF